MANLTIKYIFRFGEGGEEIIDLRIDPRTVEVVNHPCHDLPRWTRLEFEQCPHCPLDGREVTHCPVAVGLIDVVRRFDGVMSYDRVDVEVVTAERRIFESLGAQKAISALIGLLISTSGCPKTGYFKPMARFHLPLASVMETLYRAAGMYLLAQYLRRQSGLDCDPGLEGLNRIYDDMHQLNVCIAKRLKSAARTDSSINAIVRLDIFANSLPHVLKERLEEFNHLFASYL